LQKRTLAALHKPRVDDRPLWDVMLGIWGYPAVLVAHELNFFELLAEKPLTLEEVCKAKQLSRRPAETLLALCASLGLVSRRGERYSLTARSREYMLPSSPFYFGWFYNAWRPIISTWSPDSLREAVLTDKPRGVFPIPVAFSLHGTRNMQQISPARCIARASGLEWYGPASSTCRGIA